jgi:hypothetical protein
MPGPDERPLAKTGFLDKTFFSRGQDSRQLRPSEGRLIGHPRSSIFDSKKATTVIWFDEISFANPGNVNPIGSSGPPGYTFEGLKDGIMTSRMMKTQGPRHYLQMEGFCSCTRASLREAIAPCS